jgi:hypothetical protein
VPYEILVTVFSNLEDNCAVAPPTIGNDGNAWNSVESNVDCVLCPTLTI